MDAAFWTAKADLNSPDVAKRLLKAPAELVPERARLYAARLDDLRQTAGPQDTYVASSEHPLMRLQSPDEIAGLHDFLSARFTDVRYVVYMRRAEDFVQSRYSQYLRKRGTDGLEAFALKSAKRPGVADAVLRWVDVVGKDRLILRTLTRETLTGGDLIADFLDILGLARGPFTMPERRNEAFSEPAAHLLCHVNATLAEDDLGKHELSVAEMLRTAILAQLEQAAPEGRPLQMTLKARDAIRTASAEAEETLRALFFPDRDSLFPQSAEAQPPEGKGRYSARQAVDLTLAAMVRLFEPGLHRNRLMSLLTQDPTSGPARIDLIDKRRQQFGREQAGQ
jgi:hypothetical protein